MTIKMTSEMIDVGIPLTFTCQFCDSVPGIGRVFEQGNLTATREGVDGTILLTEMFMVSIDVPTGDLGMPVATLADVHICRHHTVIMRERIVSGVSFCDGQYCDGIIGDTGKSKPIPNSDGRYVEYACEFHTERRDDFHTRGWEPVD